MVEPFYHSVTDDKRNLHTEMWAQRFKDLRQYAMSLPKFGTDTADKEVQKYMHCQNGSCDFNTVMSNH